jgi:hypothetical protein
MRLGIRSGLIKRRRDDMFEPGEIEVSDVYHLSIIKAFADRIDLVNIINRLVPSRMEIDPGTLVLVMVLDALSGCHPLYRIVGRSRYAADKNLKLVYTCRHCPMPGTIRREVYHEQS